MTAKKKTRKATRKARGTASKTAAKKALKKYQSMRDFTVTAEPSGRSSGVKSSRQLRYVIQKHAATRLHYDFRLEWNGTFRSWAVTRGPSLDPADKRLAVEVEDHPLDYGDFEGTIPKGQYGGGTVMLWDRGYWAPEGDADEMLRKGDLKFVLEGEKLHGGWVLARMRGDKFGGKRNNWLLIKHHDKYAKDSNGDAVLKKDHSVASGRAMGAIEKGTGAKPKPFMRAKAFKADAVWQSKGSRSDPVGAGRGKRENTSDADDEPEPAAVKSQVKAKSLSHHPAARSSSRRSSLTPVHRT
ncbi:MAG TPA: DNA polymerase ligase N-terminal domain-containing protein, partial [Rhizomicrobium sp.]|nr:DNA polymerase ligase N-terminal domain-containing protein [Rhizomicrobium sp.]